MVGIFVSVDFLRMRYGCVCRMLPFFAIESTNAMNDHVVSKRTRPRKRCASSVPKTSLQHGKKSKEFASLNPPTTEASSLKSARQSTRQCLSLKKEQSFYATGLVDFVIGVDEVGRGCLAGPVVACACFIPLDSLSSFEDVQDSKVLDEQTRETVFATLTNSHSLVYEVAEMSPYMIDLGDILSSTMDAMNTAVRRLLQRLPAIYPNHNTFNCHILIDGNRIPSQLEHLQTTVVDERLLSVTTESVVRGDSSVMSIAAASIIAKVTRDRQLRELALQYPKYGFERHKGYATTDHIEAIQTCGILSIHRLTFRPICDWLMNNDALWPPDRERLIIDPVERRRLKKIEKQKRGTPQKTLQEYFPPQV